MVRSSVELLNCYQAGDRDFRRARLNRARLAGTRLLDIDLSGAQLTACDLSEADLSNGCLRGTQLRDARLANATLCEVDLSEADLRDATLVNSDLSDAILHRALLTGCRLQGAELARADLTEALLQHADLRRADLTEATLVGANLSNARLNGADLDGAHFDLAAIHALRHELLSASWQTLLVDGKKVSRKAVERGTQFPFEVGHPLRFTFQAKGLTGPGIQALQEALRRGSAAPGTDILTVKFGSGSGATAEVAVDSCSLAPEDSCLGLAFHMLAHRLRRQKLQQLGAGRQSTAFASIIASNESLIPEQKDLQDALRTLQLHRVDFRTRNAKQAFIRRAKGVCKSQGFAESASLWVELAPFSGDAEHSQEAEETLASALGVERHLEQVMTETLQPPRQLQPVPVPAKPVVSHETPVALPLRSIASASVALPSVPLAVAHLVARATTRSLTGFLKRARKTELTHLRSSLRATWLGEKSSEQ